MVKNQNQKFKGFISGLVALTLVLQGVFPLFNLSVIPRAFAANQTWTFDDESDFTATSKTTIDSTGGYAVVDLDFTASLDGLNSYDVTRDLIETSTGRIIAATSDSNLPYSDDDGEGWVGGGGGCGPNPSINATDLGRSGANVLAGGATPGDVPVIAYTSDDGSCWTSATVPAPSVGETTVTHFGTKFGGNMFATTNKRIWKSADDGVNWTATASAPSGEALTSILAVGTRLFVSATQSSNFSTPNIFFSDDNGDTWDEIDFPGGGIMIPGFPGIVDLAYDSTDDVVFGVSPSGGDGNFIVYSSNPQAVAPTAGAITNPNNTADATSILVTKPSFVGSGFGDVFITYDDGSIARSVTGVTGSSYFFVSNNAFSGRYANQIIRINSDGDAESDDKFLFATSDSDVYIGTYATNQTVSNADGIPFTEITAFSETVPDLSETEELAYRISNNGTTWYYWTGAAWGVSDDISTEVNSASTINTNISQFDNDVGAGNFFFQTSMKAHAGVALSNTNASSILNTLAITYTPISVSVTSPNGGEQWFNGSTHDITWTAAGISGNVVKLEYSINNGGSWVVIDNTDNVPTDNDGTYAWSLPIVQSSQALVRVSIFSSSDQSNAVFSILDHGGDQTNDDIPPVSTVQQLDGYTNDLPLDIFVIATDYQSGVDEVSLYYTKGQPASDEGDLIQFGQTKGGCPTECFNWEFSAPSGEGKYYFYSSAVDHAGNDNFEDKFGSSNFSFEAETRVDTTGPSVISHNPAQDEEMTPTAGEISIRFDERVYGARLEYDFYTLVDGEKVSALDKLGQEKWNFDMYCEPDGSGCMYPVNDLSFRIPYSGLTNNTKYYFAITELYDKAGNSLKGNYFDTELDKEIWLLRFTTVEILNPDLSQSKIEVTNLPDSGEFKPNDMVSFEATLRNASDLPATATIAIPVANGLAYCSVSPCSPASSNSGQAPLVTNDNGFVTITWTGTVTKGTDVLIRFDTKVKNPAYELSITQTATIDDGIHDELYHREATVQIADGGNFTTSKKTGSCYWKGTFQTCSDAVVGTQITYTVTITNTGTTASTRTVVDALGNYLQFIEGSGPTGAGWDSLTYDETSDSIIAIGTILPGVSKNFTFSAVFTTQAGGKTVTNVVNISEWSPDPSFSTSVPGISKDEEFSPTIVMESPSPAQHGVALDAPIVVAFSKSIDVKTFGYSVTVLGGTLVDTKEWRLEWDKYNGAKNAQVTITRPEKDKWDLGATYQVQISSGTTDTNGNILAGGSLPNPWSFTAVDPKVVISIPTDPIVRVDLNKVSPEMVVSIQDQFTSEEYVLSEPVKIGLLAEIPATGPGANKRQISKTAKFSEKSDGTFKPSTETNIFHITIPAEASHSSFYFKDSVANLVSVVAFPDPWNGWSAGTKPVLVGDVELDLGLPILQVNTDNQKIKPNTFSSPITVTATGSVGQPMLLPETLYFHTESTTGRWYNANFKPLSDYVTVQAKNPQNKLQFASVGGMSAVFYYKDAVAQSSLLTVSDNVPLSPDTGFINGNAIVTISDKVEPLLEEFPVVVDETGRELMEIVIDPSSASLLPGGLKSFKAVAKDTLGNEIENAVFKWYVVAGGGTIETNGVDGNTHNTVFTAGQEVGTFYDTIIVGTVYNGKFGFATASIKVTDLAGYAGLPITGISTIQMIFFILTMITAVALAWVEHYDKTHYAQKQ